MHQFTYGKTKPFTFQNNNNKNDNNVNIGSNNNNQNSQNVVMFNPMMGRRSLFADPKARFKRSILSDEEFCPKESETIPIWLKKSVLKSVDFFLRLKNCEKSRQKTKCHSTELNKEREILLKNSCETEETIVLEHLILGTAKIAGLELN